MHELSIAQALIEQVDKIAEKENVLVVSRITVIVGALSGVDPDALFFAFPLAAEGSRSAKAELTIEQVPAVIQCLDCQTETTLTNPAMMCSKCKSTNIKTISGSELLLKSFEAEP